MEISKDILQETTDCYKEFECLRNTNYQYCDVNQCIKNHPVVECLSKNPCSYKIWFSRQAICACPTRTEIFRKYGIHCYLFFYYCITRVYMVFQQMLHTLFLR